MSPFVASKQACPDGEFFSIQDLECKKMADPTCRSSCIGQNNGKSFRVQASDDYYYVCRENIPFVFKCPSGLIIDNIKLPDNIKPCSVLCKANSFDKFPHESDLNQYYDCDPCSASDPTSPSCPEPKKCKQFFEFDPVAKACAFAGRKGLSVDFD